MDQNDTQLIKDRLADLPQELKNLILSPELPRKINLLGRKYNLNTDQEISLQNEISFILLVIDTLEDLPKNLEENVGITRESAVSLSQDISTYIFRGVDQYLAKNKTDLVIEEEPQTPPVTPQMSVNDPNHPEHPSKERILQEIEKPSRTSIKRYIIEYDHKPINDASHLIGDKVDNITKLEEKYND